MMKTTLRKMSMMMKMNPTTVMMKMTLEIMFPGTNDAGLMCSERRNVTVRQKIYLCFVVSFSILAQMK